METDGSEYNLYFICIPAFADVSDARCTFVYSVREKDMSTSEPHNVQQKRFPCLVLLKKDSEINIPFFFLLTSVLDTKLLIPLEIPRMCVLECVLREMSNGTIVFLSE